MQFDSDNDYDDGDRNTKYNEMNNLQQYHYQQQTESKDSLTMNSCGGLE